MNQDRDSKSCNNCKHSILTSEAKFNPNYEEPFHSWNSKYACLKFATKCTDSVTGYTYYSGISSCKENRAPYFLFPTLCTPYGNHFESK